MPELRQARQQALFRRTLTGPTGVFLQGRREATRRQVTRLTLREASRRIHIAGTGGRYRAVFGSMSPTGRAPEVALWGERIMLLADSPDRVEPGDNESRSSRRDQHFSRGGEIRFFLNIDSARPGPPTSLRRHSGTGCEAGSAYRAAQTAEAWRAIPIPRTK